MAAGAFGVFYDHRYVWEDPRADKDQVRVVGRWDDRDLRIAGENGWVEVSPRSVEGLACLHAIIAAGGPVGVYAPGTRGERWFTWDIALPLCHYYWQSQERTTTTGQDAPGLISFLRNQFQGDAFLTPRPPDTTGEMLDIQREAHAMFRRPEWPNDWHSYNVRTPEVFKRERTHRARAGREGWVEPPYGRPEKWMNLQVWGFRSGALDIAVTYHSPMQFEKQMKGERENGWRRTENALSVRPDEGGLLVAMQNASRALGKLVWYGYMPKIANVRGAAIQAVQIAMRDGKVVPGETFPFVEDPELGIQVPYLHAQNSVFRRSQDQHGGGECLAEFIAEDEIDEDNRKEWFRIRVWKSRQFLAEVITGSYSTRFERGWIDRYAKIVFAHYGDCFAGLDNGPPGWSRNESWPHTPTEDCPLCYARGEPPYFQVEAAKRSPKASLGVDGKYYESCPVCGGTTFAPVR